MGLEKLIKREIAITISVVILVTTIFLMFSYAIFKVEVKTENNVITFGDISMSFCADKTCNSTINNIGNVIGTKTENGVTSYVPIYPQADPTTTSAWNALTPYTFTLTNNGGLDLYVSLYLEKDPTAYINYTVDGTSHTSQVIEDSYIKIALGEGDATPTIKTYSSTLVGSDHRIASEILIPAGETKTFHLYAWLVSNAPNASQGKHFITQISARGEYVPATTIADQILANNPVVLERTDFDSTLGTSTATNNTIYKTSGKYTEDGSEVYYFAGNVSNNWVKFGKDENNNDLYWRIIRTNEDGGLRLLYAGTSPSTTSGYITIDGNTEFTYSINSSTSDNTMYAGWKYGTSGSLENNRTNQTNQGAPKTAVDTWYNRGLNTKTDTSGNKYDAYISKTAIYCNDRSGDEYKSSGDMYYAASNRLNTNKSPSYACGMKPDKSGLYSDVDIRDKFTVSKTTGNGELTYPVGLITADEVVMAGGKYATNNSYAYYYLNSANGSVTGNKAWWTMSPFNFFYGYVYVMIAGGSNNPGYLGNDYVNNTYSVRPVVSLKSCAQISAGTGISSSPYEISINSACAKAEN